MRIGIWCPYDLGCPGGVQTHVRGLAERLRARGDEVTVLAPSRHAGRDQALGVHSIGRAFPLRVNGSVAPISLFPCTTAIAAVLARSRFHIIHVHEPFASPASCNLLRLAHATAAVVVATFHACAQRSTAYALTRPFVGHLLRGVSGRVAVSEPARDFVARYFPGQYRIIPNGVDIQRFRPEVLPLPQYRDGKRNILFLGRFEPRKGATYLLRAIPLIRACVPATRFIFAGDGALRSECEQLVTEQGWTDVVFTGHVPEGEKPALYAAADVFCAPNTGGESQGITLLEALASARPVVASDIPGFQSVICHGETGLLVPPRGHEALAQAIIALLEDDAATRRLAAAGRERALAFGWERIIDQIRDYYHALYAERLDTSPRIAPADAA